MPRRYDGNHAKLNPEPTEEQYARWRHHKARGTSPGSPKWYKPATLPAHVEFKPGRPPVYPKIETGQQYRIWHVRGNDKPVTPKYR